MRQIILILSMLAWAAPALAQGPPAPTGTPVMLADPPGTPMLVRATGYFIQARNGSVQVGPMYYAPLTEWVCDQPDTPPSTETITNPAFVEIGDEDHPGRACRLNIVTWRNALPPGTRYTAWVGAVAPAAGEVAVAPDPTTFVVGIPDFNVVPFTSSLPAPSGGRLLQ